MNSKSPFGTATMIENNEQFLNKIRSLPPYKGGDSDYGRPWGGYTTTAVYNGENDDDVIEKDITVNPGFALSVQSHVGRGEEWKAVKGTLTALIDGKLHTVEEGTSIIIPRGSIHAMINRSGEPILVHEIQTGICREDDNNRWYDMSGRAVQSSDDPRVLASIGALQSIERELRFTQARTSAPAAAAK